MKDAPFVFNLSCIFFQTDLFQGIHKMMMTKGLLSVKLGGRPQCKAARGFMLAKKPKHKKVMLK